MLLEDVPPSAPPTRRKIKVCDAVGLEYLLGVSEDSPLAMYYLPGPGPGVQVSFLLITKYFPNDNVAIISNPTTATIEACMPLYVLGYQTPS